MPISVNDIREAILSSGKITIDTEPYGTIELRELSFENMWWLKEEKTKAFTAREFTVHLVQMHIVSPELDIETIRQWQDDLLSFVACAWWREQDLSENFPSDSLSFEVFHKIVYEYSEKWHKNLLKIPSFIPSNLLGFTPFNFLGLNMPSPMKFIGENIAAGIAPVLGSFAEQQTATFQLLFNQQIAPLTNLVANTLKDVINQISLSNTIFPKINASNLFTFIPDLKELQDLLKEIQRGENSLKQAGYGFISSKEFVNFILGFDSVDQKVRNAVITNKLVHVTQDKQFKEELYLIFQQSSVLRRR